jgi:hypothetical protein
MSYCTIEDCDKPHLAKGLCMKHYGRLRKTGRTDKQKVSRTTNLRPQNSPEYISWMMMKARCLNPNHKAYPDYGGRGITICQEWVDSFNQFYRDMGSRPTDTTLDRRDGNGNYEPSNCQWSTRDVQSWNRRKTKRNNSGYIGVSKETRGGKWLAQMYIYNVNTRLGLFDTPEDAAIAYDQAAIFFRGESAVTNYL